MATKTEQQWQQWQREVGADMRCANGPDARNPAWINPRDARPSDVVQAKQVCLACPLQQDCQRWLATALFKNFEGVMGGEVREPTKDFAAA